MLQTNYQEWILWNEKSLDGALHFEIPYFRDVRSWV